MDNIYLHSLYDFFDIHRRLSNNMDIKYPQKDDIIEVFFTDGNHVYMSSTWAGRDYIIKDLNIFVYRNHLFTFMMSGELLLVDSLLTGDYMERAKNAASVGSVNRIRFALDNMFEHFPTEEFMTKGLDVSDIRHFLGNEGSYVLFIRDMVSDVHDSPASPYAFYWAFKSVMSFLGRDMGGCYMVLSLPISSDAETDRACVRLLEDNFRFRIGDVAAGGLL